MNRLKVQVEGEELRSEASGTPGRKKYKLVFLIGSFKNKSIKVWYSKAQGKHMRSQKKPEVHSTLLGLGFSTMMTSFSNYEYVRI